MTLPTFFYDEYINKRERNNHYLQFTISDLLSKDVVFIPANINENHWLLLVILPLARTVISIDYLSYENNSVLDFALFFLKHTLVYIKSVSTKNIGGIIITKLFENKKIDPTVVY